MKFGEKTCAKLGVTEMSEIITRKCAKCKGEIEIDVHDIKDVVYFEKKFYHKTCFIETATKKAASKRSSLGWQSALNDGLRQVQNDAVYNIEYCYGRDLLFEHLLNNYNVCAISSYANMNISNVVSGKYKGKSKPISYKELAMCWIEGQKALDKINADNHQLGKNMTGDQRIIYDLAVVVNKFPKWKSAKIKLDNERQRIAKEARFEEVDMSRIGQVQQVKKKDISDISDDIFVE